MDGSKPPPTALPLSFGGEASTEMSDRSGFAALYARCQALAAARLRYHGVRPSDLDDSLQEVFLVVFRRLDQLTTDEAQQRAWIRGVCRKVASRYHRGRQRKGRLHAQARLARSLHDQTGDRPDERDALDVVQRFLGQIDEQRAEIFALTAISDDRSGSSS